MKIKRLLIPFAAILSLVLTTCDQEDVDLGLSYQSMLNDAYQTTGEGRIIPVTIEQASELDGTITRDGKYLYYASDSDRGNFEIYLRSMRNITSVRLTNHPSKDYSPAISPNGKYLAFISNREDPEGDVYVIALRARELLKKVKEEKQQASLGLRPKNISQITDASTHSKIVMRDQHPAWSPDSKKIVFTSVRGGDTLENIWMCDRNGRNMEQLTTAGGSYPSFSPDNKKLVYISYRNPENNGDVYMLDLETKVETQITDSKSIEMYPGFIKDSTSISYTLVDRDTNNDKVIDLNDNSVIFFRDISANKEYPLTFYSVSSFGAKWFPIYGLQYAETGEFNFNGILVYAQQFSSNINLNIVPEYGVIPKKLTAKEQYAVAAHYLSQFNDYERYQLALLRVYYFFGDRTDDESVRYTTKALKNAYLDAAHGGNSEDFEMVDKLFKSYINGTGDDDYRRVVYNYCEKERSKSASVPLLESGTVRVSEYFKPVLLEDIAEHYSETPSAKKTKYQNLLQQYPSYDSTEKIRFELAKLDAASADFFSENIQQVFSQFPDEEAWQLQVVVLRELLLLKSSEQSLISDDLLSKIGSSSMSETGKSRYSSVAKYIKAFALLAGGDKAASRRTAAEAIEISQKQGPIYYRSSLLLADICRLEEVDGEEENLSAAALNYNPSWKQADYTNVVHRLIAIYENKGADFENANKYSRAIEVYEKYADFLSFLKGNSDETFAELYNEYGTRAHILYIDAYYLKHRQKYSSLENLEEKYLHNLRRARSSFDKAYLYALGYLYTKKALHLDRELIEKGTLSGIERGGSAGTTALNEETIASSFRNAVDSLDWSIFIDDQFADAILLKGWILQYVDRRRQKEEDGDTVVFRTINKYFPDYLLEQNKDMYERAIELNNELKYPEKEGNLYLNLANTYFMLTNYTEALLSYQAAKKFKTRFSSQTEEALYYYHYGYCFWQTGDNDAAREEFGKTIQIYKNLGGGIVSRKYAPQIVTLYLYNALFDQLEGKYESAVKWYENVLAIDAEYNVGVDRARHMQEIAFCLKELKRYDEALSQIARTDRLLRTYEDKPYIHNLSIYLYNFPVFRMDIGQTSTVVGGAQLNRELDTYTKRLYNFALREEIYTLKNDVSALLNVQKRKISWLKSDPRREKNYKIYNDARVVALNNLAISYFRMRNYSRCEKNLNEAWEFAESKKDNEGIFRTIQNLTDFYAHLLEKRDPYLEDPEKKLNSFVKVIRQYRNDFEKKRYAAARTALKAAHKEKGFPPPTPEEYQALLEKVRADAEKIYYLIDINQAILDYYRAGILYDKYSAAASPRDGYDIYKQNSEIFYLYAKSAGTFEGSIDNKKVSNRMKVKLLLNASVCKQRMGAIKEGFLLLGKAEELAKKFRFDDLLFDTYVREAYYTEDNRTVLTLKEKDVLAFYENAAAIVSDFPQLYYENQVLINEFYDRYTKNIVKSAKPEAIVLLREQRRKINLINQVYSAGPTFSEYADQQTFAQTSYLLNEYLYLRSRTNEEIGRGAKESSPSVVALLAKMSDIKNTIATLNAKSSLFTSFVVMGKQLKIDLPRSSAVVDFLYTGNTLYAWIIAGKGVQQKVYTTSAPRDQLSVLADELQKKYENVYFIAEEQNFSLPGSEAALAAPVQYIFALSDLQYIEASRVSFAGKLLTVDRSIDDQEGDEVLDFSDYSSVADNTSGVVEVSRKVLSGDLRPSLTVKKYFADTFDRTALLYYASLYSGGTNFVLYRGDASIPVANGAVVFGDAINYSDLNKTLFPAEGFINFRRGGAVRADSQEQVAILQAFLADYNSALVAGRYDDARYSLSQWKELNGDSPDIQAQYALLSSKIDDVQCNPSAGYAKLSSIRTAQLTDQNLVQQIDSYMLYYLFRSGNQQAAVRELERITDANPFKASNDYIFYANLADGISKGVISAEVTGQFIIEPERLLSLLFNYHLLLGDRDSAQKIAGIIDTSKLYEFEFLMLNAFYPQKDNAANPRGQRVQKILKIDTLGGTVELQSAFRDAAEQDGAYDIYSRYALLVLMRKLGAINRSVMINVSINASNIQSLMAGSGSIENLLVYNELESLYRNMHRNYVAEQVCTFAVDLANQSGFTAVKESFQLKQAEHYCLQQKFNEARGLLSSVAQSARGAAPESWFFNKYNLLSAEVALRTNRRADATAAIAASEKSRDGLTRLSLSLESELFTREGAAYDQVAREMITLINRDNSSLYLCERPDVVDRSLAIYEERLALEGNSVGALGISEIRHKISTARYLAGYSVYSKNGNVEAGSFTISDELAVDKLQKELPSGAAILVIDRAANDLICYVISPSDISVQLLQSGYEQYQLLQDSLHSTLLSIGSVDTIKAQYDTLFADIIDKVNSYETLYCVFDLPVVSLPVEILGNETILYEKTNILFMPSLGSAFTKHPAPARMNLSLMQPSTPGFTDSIEVLAIRESGIEVVKNGLSSLAHIQSDLFYDDLSGSAYVGEREYREVLGEYNFVYLSSGSISSFDYASLASGLFEKRVAGIVINRAHIRDVNSAIIGKQFYSGIKGGRRVDDSFYNARLLLYKNMKYEHPSYWLYNRLYVSGVRTD